MQIFLMSLLLLIVIVFAIHRLFAKKTTSQALSPTSAELPLQKLNNEKIVIIKGAGLYTIKEALQQFCSDYNKSSYIVVANLIALPNGILAITFPYGIRFDLLCFLVNYMQYPKDITYNAEIKAWATAIPTDEWIGRKAANKSVLLYMPDDDKEYDNVFVCTEDNIGYKLSFASGLHLLDHSLLSYAEPPVSYEQLKGMHSEEIE